MEASATSTMASEPWIPRWEGARYAANTEHHRVHDDWFLRAFPSRPTDRILDLGCGSGDFTRVVADRVPEGEVVGVDAQPSMIAEARRVAAPHQRFIVAPVQALETVLPSPAHDGSFDIVMSRSALHWVPLADVQEVYRHAHRLLRPGGWLRVECGGAGNVPSVVTALDAIAARYGGPSRPWNFADAGTTLELIERAGFVGDDGFIETVAQRRPFTRATFEGWLHSQAIEAYRSGIPEDQHEAFTAEVDARIDEFRRHDGSFDLTYVRLNLLVRRG